MAVLIPTYSTYNIQQMIMSKLSWIISKTFRVHVKECLCNVAFGIMKCLVFDNDNFKNQTVQNAQYKDCKLFYHYQLIHFIFVDLILLPHTSIFNNPYTIWEIVKKSKEKWSTMKFPKNAKSNLPWNVSVTDCDSTILPLWILTVPFLSS